MFFNTCLLTINLCCCYKLLKVTEPKLGHTLKLLKPSKRFMANILYTARLTHNATRHNQGIRLMNVCKPRFRFTSRSRPIGIICSKGSDSRRAYGDKKNQYCLKNYSQMISSDFSDSPGFFKTSALQCRRFAFGEE